MLSTMPAVSRDQRIRDAFAQAGAMTTGEFARHCIEIGIYTEEDLESFAIQHVQSEVRKALKRPDLTGLPFAGQTTEKVDGAAVWKQRNLWTYDDYAVNIRELITQRDTLHTEAVKLSDECRERFGIAPDVFTVSPN